MFAKTLILLSFWLYTSNCFAQSYSLQVVDSQQNKNDIFAKYFLTTQVGDTLVGKRILLQGLQNLHQAGYLAASFDSVRIKKQTIFAYLYCGEPYQWLQLQTANIPDEMLKNAGWKPKNFSQKRLHYTDFLQLKTKLLAHAQNIGYPFATVFLDSVKVQAQQVSATLHYQQGTAIVFDSLIIVGKNPLKMKKKFLADYLKLYRKQPFSQKKVDDAEKLLRTLPYLKLLSKPEIVFERDRAFVLLHTEALKVNQFDGIVGLLPNALNNNQLQLTGQINLKLYNLFQAGKNLQLDWQSPRVQSQLLNVQYEHPNLFKTRIDVGAKLHLNKRDTSFVNFSWSLQLGYWLGGGAKLLAFTEFLQTTADSAQINQPNKQVAATELQRYGIGLEFQNLDDRLAPRRGWQLQFLTSAGNKVIKPQWELNNPIYKDLQLQSTQIQANFSVSRFVPTGKNTALLFRHNSGILLNSNLFTNELFQLGGFKTLRGFNELTFFSPFYAIQTAEWRLYFAENSNLFAFIDHAFIEMPKNTAYRWDSPLGLGGGFSFGTKAGIFSFVAALGKSETQAIGINQMKIHFGLTTRF